MFHNKFFSRRLRQKSEEIIPKRISRFFHSGNTTTTTRSESHVSFSDKLEIPTTSDANDWYYACPQHASTEDMMLIVKEGILVEPDLSTFGGSNTTIDDDVVRYDDVPIAEGQEDGELQQKRCMQLADHVRIVIGNAFEEADEQLEKEHLL